MSSTDLSTEPIVKCEPEESRDEDNSYNDQIEENYVYVNPELSLEYKPVKIELNRIECNDNNEQWKEIAPSNKIGAEDLNIKCEPGESRDEDNSHYHQTEENYVHMRPEFSLEYIPVKVEINKKDDDNVEQWNDYSSNEIVAECEESEGFEKPEDITRRNAQNCKNYRERIKRANKSSSVVKKKTNSDYCRAYRQRKKLLAQQRQSESEVSHNPSTPSVQMTLEQQPASIITEPTGQFSEVYIKCEPGESKDEDNSYYHQKGENDDRGNEIGAECEGSGDKGDMNAVSNTIKKKSIQIKKSRNSDDIDEDYVSPIKSKKIKREPNVRPSIKSKPRKKNGVRYSDDITQHIEIVTIDEQERQIEHRELMNGRRHMRYQCEDCAVGFVVIEAYTKHMKVHSPENGEYECDLCHTRVKTGGALYEHKLRHYRRYRCALCHSRHRDRSMAAAHVMEQHLGTAFLCMHCGRGFKRPQYLKRHIEQIHTKPHRFECPVCQRVFHERGWYRCHVRSHKEEARNSTPEVICAHCDRSFKKKSDLKRHLRRHEDGRLPTARGSSTTSRC